MTKEEAEQKLATYRRGNWFCPLIKCECEPRCLCYNPPYVYVSNSESPEDQQICLVAGDYCTAYSLMGPRRE